MKFFFPSNSLVLGVAIAASSGHVLAVSKSGSDGETPRTEMSPKLMFRMTSGYLGNFGIGWEKPISSSISLGIDYRVESDSAAMIRGFDVFLRYYFLRPGTRIERWTSHDDQITTHQSWSPYVGIEGMSRDYGVQRSGAASSGAATGSLSGFNGIAGVNFRISKSVEVGAESAIRFLTSFQTDASIEPQSLIFILTFNYLY